MPACPSRARPNLGGSSRRLAPTHTRTRTHTHMHTHTHTQTRELASIFRCPPNGVPHLSLSGCSRASSRGASTANFQTKNSSSSSSSSYYHYHYHYHPAPPAKAPPAPGDGYWIFIKGGCSGRGVQWIGVVLHNKLVHDTIQITTPCFHCTPLCGM